MSDKLVYSRCVLFFSKSCMLFVSKPFFVGDALRFGVVCGVWVVCSLFGALFLSAKFSISYFFCSIDPSILFYWLLTSLSIWFLISSLFSRNRCPCLVFGLHVYIINHVYISGALSTWVFDAPFFSLFPGQFLKIYAEGRSV